MGDATDEDVDDLSDVEAGPASVPPSSSTTQPHSPSAPNSRRYSGGGGGNDSDEDEAEAEEDVAKDEAILRQGFLYKRSKTRMVWKKRWCVLRRTRLCVYKDEEEYKALKIVKTADCVATQVFKHKNRVFKLVTPKRKFYFKAATSDEMHGWVGAINAGRSLRNIPVGQDDEDDVVDVEVEASPPFESTTTTQPLSTGVNTSKIRADAETSESDYDSDGGGRGPHSSAPIAASPPKSDDTSQALQKMSDADHVIKSGYLLKKGHVNKRWKRRWFVLRSSGQLCYYKTNKEYELLQIIKMKDITEIGRVVGHKRPYMFQINTPKRDYRISCETDEEVTEWLTCLQTEFSKAGQSHLHMDK